MGMDNPTVFLNGVFLPLSCARVSILDRGFCYGDGLFETMRAYRGRVFKIDSHLERLLCSLEKILLELPVTRGEIKSIIRETLIRNSYQDAIVRLTVSRGTQTPGLKIDPGIAPTLVVHARPFLPLPASWHRNGVQISLFPGTAVRTSGLDLQVKSCNYLSQILLLEQAARQNSIEGIMVDGNDRVTEGSVSNIFLVKDGTLITPALSEYVLPGITRQVVLEIGKSQGIDCRERNVNCEELFSSDEIFLTNSGVEILPVRQIDDAIIGDGSPGQITRNLQNEFSRVVVAG
jgi:branched-chain amino acid aminotransferase